MPRMAHCGFVRPPSVFKKNAGNGPMNQVHTHPLLGTMRHRATQPRSTTPSAHTSAVTHNAAQGYPAKIHDAKCTRIRCYAQCGTGLPSQHPRRQVHTHPLLRTMRHRATLPTSTTPSAHASALTHNAAQGHPAKIHHAQPRR
jgi:hypothetical protein